MFFKTLGCDYHINVINAKVKSKKLYEGGLQSQIKNVVRIELWFLFMWSDFGNWRWAENFSSHPQRCVACRSKLRIYLEYCKDMKLYIDKERKHKLL